MELDEAANSVQVMLNFFNGLQKLQEVINVARTVDNIKQLSEERHAAAEKARQELISVRSDLESFTTAAKSQKAAMEQVLKNAQDKFARDVADLDSQFAAKTETAIRNFEAMKASKDDLGAKLNKEIQDLTEKRDVLLKDVAKADKALSDIKSRIAGI